MKRAVITGLGIVSSIGNNQQEVLAIRPWWTFRDHFLSGAEGFRHA